MSLCSTEALFVLIGTHASDRHLSAESGDLSWWYAAPRNGHISLHSHRSMQELAKRYSLSYLAISEQTHVLFRGYTQAEASRFLWRGKERWGGARRPVRRAR